MTTYGASAEALRDTTKWLTAFLPVATLVASAAVIGPGTLRDLTGGEGSVGGIWHNGEFFAGLGLVVAGIAIILILGGRVLSAQPKNLATVLSREFESELNQAFNDGVGFPYYLKAKTFRDAVNALQISASVADAESTRALAASELLREWCLYAAVKKTFRDFTVGLAFATTAIGIGIYLSSANGPVTSAKIDSPRDVQVNMNVSGANALYSATGCTNAAETTFRAVGGSWLRPLLTANGPGCRFGAEWLPQEDMVEVKASDTE